MVMGGGGVGVVLLRHDYQYTSVFESALAHL